MFIKKGGDPVLVRKKKEAYLQKRRLVTNKSILGLEWVKEKSSLLSSDKKIPFKLERLRNFNQKGGGGGNFSRLGGSRWLEVVREKNWVMRSGKEGTDRSFFTGNLSIHSRGS